MKPTPIRSIVPSGSLVAAFLGGALPTVGARREARRWWDEFEALPIGPERARDIRRGIDVADALIARFGRRVAKRRLAKAAAMERRDRKGGARQVDDALDGIGHPGVAAGGVLHEPPRDGIDLARRGDARWVRG